MIAIRYRIELQEPTLLTGLEGDPNSAVSTDFIPGSALRGAFISSLLRQNQHADLSPFLSGQVRFLNAYIVVSNKRSLPLPLSLRKEKNATEADPIIDMANKDIAKADPIGQTVNEDRPANVAEKQWQNVGGGFASVDARGKGIAANVKRQLAIHTARDRRAGTARPDSGAVYRYDAIGPLQTFEAVALCERVEEADLICSLVEEMDRLGGSARAGYGKVDVTFIGTEEQGWREHSFSTARPGERQVALLLSDALLRDACGQYTVSPEILACAIKRGTSIEDAFIETILVGAFNRTWGLPLPQALGFRRGTVLVLPAGSLSASEIDILENKGIGERRSEGFGRVAVFSPVSSWNISRDVGRSDPGFSTLSGVDEIEVATLISRRVNEARQAEESLVRLKTMTTERRELTSSQIARLRETLLHESLVENPTLSCIETFIGRLTAKTTLQWKKAKVGAGGQDLLSWLDGYKALRAEFKSNPPEIGDQQYEEKAAEQVKRQLRFVDSVLARMQKEKETRP